MGVDSECIVLNRFCLPRTVATETDPVIYDYRTVSVELDEKKGSFQGSRPFKLPLSF